MSSHHLVFDGHNDVLTRLYQGGRSQAVSSFTGGRSGDIDLPRAREGGFAGGLFAIWLPSPMNLDDKLDAMSQPSYDMPLPEPLSLSEATPVFMAQCAILLELERSGALAICRTVAEIRNAMANGKMAAVMHLEGAEPIDVDLNALDVMYAAGLRSLGPVWSRNTSFASGVPFRYPSTPDIGEGLTDHGKSLVERCDALGVAIDLSHLNEAGFWDVARLSKNPLIASHSNVHAICPHSRNLTDEQMRAIRDSDGLVGLNFAAAFLRPDGRMIADTDIDIMLRHLDHMLEILGEDRVGLGSDYDGAICPQAIAGVENLPKLRQIMVDHGYGSELIAKICHENWLRVLDLVWND